MIRFDSENLKSTPENWKTPPASVRKTGVNSENLESNPEIWNPARKTGIYSEKPESSPENWNPALSLKPLNNINNLNINQEEVLREAQFRKTGPDSGNLEKEAVRAYYAILGLRPNQAQRAAIAEEVKDLALWQATLGALADAPLEPQEHPRHPGAVRPRRTGRLPLLPQG